MISAGFGFSGPFGKGKHRQQIDVGESECVAGDKRALCQRFVQALHTVDKARSTPLGEGWNLLIVDGSRERAPTVRGVAIAESLRTGHEKRIEDSVVLVQDLGALLGRGPQEGPLGVQ